MAELYAYYISHQGGQETLSSFMPLLKPRLYFTIKAFIFSFVPQKPKFAFGDVLHIQ